ncbi:MAG TPA: hypothetical protein VF173_01530 [Thermoanaerobaculia bacterium]|nr:hypothetical protein [Thermoanaerobaculia bacterium]
MAALPNPGKLFLWAVRAAALGVLLLGLGADLLGIGEPGFGERQWLMVIVGAMVLAVSFLGTRARAGLQGFRAAWVNAAVIVFNTAVGFLLLNLLIALGMRLTGRAQPAGEGIDSPWMSIPLVRLTHIAGSRAKVPSLALPDAQLAQIYPGWTRRQVEDLLAESWGRSLRFHPYTGLAEQPFRGRYVNIVEPGLRLIRDPGPWPMASGAHNVWVFGGSTTFGYGLADWETIPSHLQVTLRRRYPGAPIHVYNFGQGYFFSSQELALFQSLLASGSAPPEVVLFIDGINEHFQNPFYTSHLQKLVRSPWTAPQIPDEEPSIPRGEDVVSRWLRNKRMIEGVSAAYGIKPLFIWQPAPNWKYDLRHHLLWWNGKEKMPATNGPVYGDSPHYAAMDRLRMSSPETLGKDFLYLGDLQLGETRPLYVDRLHYTSAFAQKIAEQVADRIQQGL